MKSDKQDGKEETPSKGKETSKAAQSPSGATKPKATVTGAGAQKKATGAKTGAQAASASGKGGAKSGAATKAADSAKATGAGKAATKGGAATSASDGKKTEAKGEPKTSVKANAKTNGKQAEVKPAASQSKPATQAKDSQASKNQSQAKTGAQTQKPKAGTAKSDKPQAEKNKAETPKAEKPKSDAGASDGKKAKPKEDAPKSKREPAKPASSSDGEFSGAKGSKKKKPAKKKKGMGGFAKFMLTMLFLVVLGVGAVAGGVWYFVLDPVKVPDGYKLEVKEGSGVFQLSNDLERDGVIRNARIFRRVAAKMGLRSLKQGKWKLPSEVNSVDIVKTLLKEDPMRFSFRIKEGGRVKDMLQELAKDPEVKHVLKDGSIDKVREIIDPTGEHPSLEGLFFPDTYVLLDGESDVDILRRAHERMEKELAKAWEGRKEGLPYETPYDLLRMASIVEKETSKEADRAHVATVFVNRLKTGMKLQADPTVIYGLYNEGMDTKLTKKALQLDTPYNTYTREGLPPTPISLVSRASLEAAAHPSDEEYYYFVSKMDETGESHFSKDLKEHNKAVRKYILKK